MGKIEINIDNIKTLDFNTIRKELFDMVKTHKDLLYDEGIYIELLGYYPAIYSYISELYVHMMNQVRLAPNKEALGAYRVRRDMLEQLLKNIRLQYDTLSRKITVIKNEHDQTMRFGA